MTNANTHVIAKAAAIVAGAGLVLSSFAFAIPAGAQTATATPTTTSAMFTRDLTIGSTGADVTALQTWLIGKGFAIPAGATGYFGAQTQAAVAAYQAANAITPAAGYFGPITRAKVNAGGSVVVPGDDDDNDNDDEDDEDEDDDELSGGEADLTDFDLVSEETTLDENEDDVEIATAEFDVEDGDVRVERAELFFQAQDTNLEDQPWDFIDAIKVWNGDDELAEMEVSDRDEWNEEDANDAGEADVYSVSFTELDYVVDEGDMAELTFSVDVAGNIDTTDQDQEFDVWVADDGIRAVDGEGVDHYVGDGEEDDSDDADSVEITFGEEESGDLSVRTDSDDPDSMTLISDDDDESDEYKVFVFNIDNDDDADSEVTDLTIEVTDGAGTVLTTEALDEILSEATLKVDGEDYDGDIDETVSAAVDTIEFDDLDEVEVGGDDETKFELHVRIARDATDTQLEFSVDGSDIEAEGVDSGDDTEVDGSASSETHTVAGDGIMARAEQDDNGSYNEADSSTNDAGDGTFRITFTVEALEEDVFIDRSALEGESTEDNGFGYFVFVNGSVTAQTGETATVQSNADTEGTFFVVREGDEEEFTLTVSIPAATNGGSTYVELDNIFFDTDNDLGVDLGAQYEVPDESEFESEVETVA